MDLHGSQNLDEDGGVRFRCTPINAAPPAAPAAHGLSRPKSGGRYAAMPRTPSSAAAGAAKLDHGEKGGLVRGMPADVLIVRRERTMVNYLLEPFREAFRWSFREV